MNIYDTEGGVIDLLILKDAIANLPVKERVVTALRSAGYTQRECGEIMGITRSAIGFAEKRALHKLRKTLEGGNE